MQEILPSFSRGCRPHDRVSRAENAVARVLLPEHHNTVSGSRQAWNFEHRRHVMIDRVVRRERCQLAKAEREYKADPVHRQLGLARVVHAELVHSARVNRCYACRVLSWRHRGNLRRLEQRRDCMRKLYVQCHEQRFQEALQAWHASKYLLARTCVQLISDAERSGTPWRRISAMQALLCLMEPCIADELNRVVLPFSPKPEAH